MRHLRMLLLAILLVALTRSVSFALGEEVVLPTGERVTVERAGSDTVITLANGARVIRSEVGNSVAWRAAPTVSEGDMDKAEQAYAIWAAAHPAPRAPGARTVPLWFALLLMAVGLLNAVFPYVGWYLELGWKLRGAEPSEAALAVNRWAGAALAAVGLILLWI